MLGGDYRYSMTECVCNDDTWTCIMRIEAECCGVVIVEPRGYGEEEGVLTHMEFETIVVLHYL